MKRMILAFLKALFGKKQTVEIPKIPDEMPKTPDDPGNVVNVTGRELFLRNEILAMTQGKHLGVKENLPYRNRGEVMDAALKFMGIGLGNSYCIAAALYYGVHLVCKKHGLNYGALKMTASTQSFYRFIMANAEFKKYWRAKGTPAKKGDLATQRNKTDHDHGHEYIVAEDEVAKYADGTGDHKTFEYNTDPNGGANSVGCFSLIRKKAHSGSASKDYLGAFDVVAYLLDKNPNWTPKA